MPMNWNDQADAKLLLAIITKSDTKINWTGIAEYMGPDCSVSAVQHRVQRLKDRARASDASPTTSTNRGEYGSSSSKAEGTGSGSATTSPEKRKRGRPRKNIPVGGNAEYGSGGEDGGSLAKMQKGGKAQAQGRGAIKMVEGEEGLIGNMGDEAERIKMEQENGSEYA